jgi:hypothetical protein
MSHGLIRQLFLGPIDIVGDIHGEIDALRHLLGHLGMTGAVRISVKHRPGRLSIRSLRCTGGRLRRWIRLWIFGGIERWRRRKRQKEWKV